MDRSSALGKWARPLSSLGKSNDSVPGNSRNHPSGGGNGSSPLPAIENSNDLSLDRDNNAFLSDDDRDSGSEEGEPRLTLGNLESSIFKGYLGSQKQGMSAAESSFQPGLSKIRDLLVASRIGAISCLICLEKVRVSDPVWDCKAGCHAVYHLICIQAWAGQASNAAAERARSRLSQEHFPEAAAQAGWHCPKCRTEYTRAQIPRESRCFCGKVVDPPLDPWLTPHSCGEICGQLLPGDCGHECKLLCHPGACPPCPQFVKAKCFCGAESEVRRCGHKQFSCGTACGKGLACGIHECEEDCHVGACPPCKRTGLHRCRCGRTQEVRSCAGADFQCDQPCEKELHCKKHWCKKVCHSGSCGECELQGRRTCPCGKVEYKGMACDVTVPTCGSTCEKWLDCSVHRCQERCHFGSCRSTCRVVTKKLCRCGSLRKEVPCFQDLQCERKCQRMRDCARHPCKRRCCDGDCPPCSEVCGRKLRCGNHKCPAPCHRGLCAPCPVTVRIACACGSTAYEVPCGTEREQRPPRCSKRCLIPPHCKHGVDCKPHRCHYGACPSCQLVCNKELPCGHKCKQRCHGPRPPPNPEFTLKQRKKRKGPEHDEQISGSPCLPCFERVLRRCLGCHSGGERIMVCSESFAFGCGRPCGNPLACGNHFCQKPCHEVTVPRGAYAESQAASEESQVDAIKGCKDAGMSPNSIGKSCSTGDESQEAESVDTCEQCTMTCQKNRVPSCPHPCMQACHSGDCSPCRALVKRPCYCGTLVHAFECSSFNSLPEADRKKKLSCGGPCHRKLPNCTHLCPETCHSGPCAMATNCRKKVAVRCLCLRLKKDWICSDVQAAYSSRKPEGLRSLVGVGLLACDEECLRLTEQQKLKEEMDQIRQRKSAVVEDLPTNKMPKRRKRHDSINFKSDNSKMKEISYKVLRWILLLASILFIILVFYFGYRGLQALSDRMNEIDARRPRKRPPGSLIM